MNKQYKYRESQRKAKESIRLNSNQPVREPEYHPPTLRGIRIYGDFDMGYLRLVYISLWNSGRIDSYYIRREKPEYIGKRPRLNDGNNDWWLDNKGNKKKYGKTNLDKAIRDMMPNIRRVD